MSFSLRQLGRVCTGVIAVHTFMTATLFTYSLTRTDRLFESHWRYSTPVHIVRRNRYCFWRRSFYEPFLNDDARECLLTTLRAYTLDTDAITSKEIAANIVVQDSLCRLDGRGEFRDGVYMLEKLFERVEVDVKEVREEIQGHEATFVHCKVDLSVFLRVPWTSFTFRAVSLPVAITLQLQHSKAFRGKQIVTALENRWFGGAICSVQTGSMKSPWGDVGDLVRRYNGFMLSSLLTKQETMKLRIDLSHFRARLNKLNSEELDDAAFTRSLSGDV